MPMSVPALTTLIKSKTATKLAAVNPAAFEDVHEYGEAVNHATAEAIAEAVIEHITAAAQVLPGIPVATTGSQSAQTGATTAAGVIT